MVPAECEDIPNLYPTALEYVKDTTFFPVDCRKGEKLLAFKMAIFSLK